MSIFRYRQEEARNIAAAQRAATQQAKVEGSLAKKAANTDISDLQNQIDNLDKASVGLPDVDNTSDADKPISDATQAALALKLQWATVPASTGATGTAGQIAYDSSFIYVCVATNTWKRAALSTW